jgi:hypothetical protein
MPSKWESIKRELEGRMSAIQGQVDRLKEQKARIDEKLHDANSKLAALRVVYEMEAERFGKQRLPLSSTKGRRYRFIGMKLSEALMVLRKEQPEISKKEACQMLQKYGFDFKGKRPLTAVHFAWISLENREKKEG